MDRFVSCPRVEGLGFGVWGLGFRVSGLGFRASGLGLSGLGCSPFYEQSFIGIIVPPIGLPIEDCVYKWRHPKVLAFTTLSGFLGLGFRVFGVGVFSPGGLEFWGLG